MAPKMGATTDEPTREPSRRKRGRSPEYGLLGALKEGEGELKKPKKGSKATSAKRKVTAGLPPTLPRVPPHEHYFLPSPHAIPMDDWALANGDYTILKIQYLMGRPNFDEADGRAFARWFRTRVANDVPQEPAGWFRTTVANDSWIGACGLIAWDDLEVKAPQKRKTANWGRANAPRPRKAIEVYREEIEGENEYFLRYEMIREVKVNNHSCTYAGTADFAIGPLPAFAVIEVDTAMIFWWRDAAALDYVSSEWETAIREQSDEEEEQADEEEEQTPHTPHTPTPSKGDPGINTPADTSSAADEAENDEETLDAPEDAGAEGQETENPPNNSTAQEDEEWKRKIDELIRISRDPMTPGRAGRLLRYCYEDVEDAEVLGRKSFDPRDGKW
ncbi:MAG: hypothetical protein Q9218_003969 [Villophora microphyllina]